MAKIKFKKYSALPVFKATTLKQTLFSSILAEVKGSVSNCF